jgi:hypothetical protein
LSIADCRLSIEKVARQVPPLSIGNRKSPIPANLGRTPQLPLRVPTREAVHEYRKDDERNRDVKPVPLHGESSNREGNARHWRCD